MDEECQKSQQLDSENEKLREEIKQQENFNAAKITSLSRYETGCGRGCMHCEKNNLFVCLFSAAAAACRVSGNLIASLLVVLAINFHGETKFSAKNLFGKVVAHNHKKILLLPT